MPADAILSSNNNNNNTAKNFQTSAPNPTTDGGQFHFSPASHPNPPPQLHQSMSPALGGGGVAAAASTGLGPGTMTKTLNQSGVTITTTQGSATGPNMLPAGVQIVNMRPGAPTMQHATTTTVQQQQQQQGQQQQLPGQRTVATVQPRIVIGSQNVVTTANNRQATNSLQLGQGPTLLLKTESGQFQLLRVGTAPAGAGQAAGVTGGMQHTLTSPAGIVTTGAGGNQTIRLQTMPASTPTSNIVLTSNATSAANTHPSLASVSSGVPTVVVSSASAAATAPTTMVVTAATPQTVQQNTKEKCRKFLANLLDLSSREPKSVEKNVRTLIQELIDNAVEPEGFCHRLERLLNASPQPCLIGFLKKSLPVLRQSLVRKELTIDGIKPPPHNVAFPNAVAIAGTTTTVRPVGAGAGGQAIIPRMGAPGAAPRPTTITRHTPVRIGAAPRLAINQLRPVTAIPALQPVQMRTTTPTGGAMIRPLVPAGSVTKVVKVGQAQLKQVTGPQLTAVSGSHVVVSRAPAITTITQRPGTASMGGATIVSASSAALTSSSPSTGPAMTSQASAMAAAAQKERKASFYQHNSISSSSIYGDDEINDVAAMGGVNLAEESQRILGSTELIGTQIRSCKDEVFLHLPALQSKIRAIVARHGLEEASADVAVLVSHAAQERLKNIVEKLAVIAEHRVDVIKLDPRYEVTKDVRGQVKFLEELDKAEQKRHDEQEREMLLRAAKSRTKNEDPEQAKLKAKAKEMQRAEMEELRQRDANLTALQAIGMRKKPRLDGDAATTGTTSGTSGSGSGSGFSSTPLRPRLKRVNLRDMIFYLEQERETCRSSMLYRAYLK